MFATSDPPVQPPKKGSGGIWIVVAAQFSAFGQTEWSTQDQATFAAGLSCVRDAAPVVEMMNSRVPEQQWGLGKMSDAAFEGGWGPRVGGGHEGRQVGIVTTVAGRVGVAVAAQPNSGSFDDGTAMLDAVGGWLESHSAQLPAGHCLWICGGSDGAGNLWRASESSATKGPAVNDALPTDSSEPTTIAEYLNAHSLRVSPLDGAAAAEVGITVPIPAGWQTLDPAQFPGATQVIVEPNLVENGFAPNAVLLVGALSRTIDPDALMALGFGDGRAMPGWVEREASEAPWLGWPSRFIRGTYVAEQLEAAVTTRYVVVGVDTQYLVQLTVTTLASQLDALAFDVAAINDGLTTNGS